MKHNLRDVKNEFCTLYCNAKDQSLDLGMIAHSKIRFRSLLIRTVIEIILRQSICGLASPSSNQKGRLGLQDGFL